MLAARELCLAFEAQRECYHMGAPFGLAETQLALALNSPLREDMIAAVIRGLAERPAPRQGAV